MSLIALCSTSTATIKRVASTSGASMGAARAYTTASRGSLPTTSTGRLQQVSDERRFKFMEKDVQIDAVWYTVTDPQCNNQDQLIVGSDTYFVHAQRNPDLLGRFYRLDLKAYSQGVQ